MQVVISETKQELGRRAAQDGAEKIRRALAARGAANIVVATGASQFEMLEALVAAEKIDWGRVTGFHLDEYVGLPATHPASFRKYLKERFVERLPRPLGAFYYIDGEGDVAAECRRLNEVIAAHPTDVAFVGIGENGHLAFNDPPANFETEVPYLVVNLDEACRRQQFGEGWFPSLEDVPAQAISMSIRQILKADAIVCSVPDARKAEAVRGSLEGPVTPQVPASVLQRHRDTTVYLDTASAALLSR
uniref:Glucosamine-6-phosphate deaminase n=1 Tax=uncultured Armatimonadetes bacterium TaxID=157466 RepID=A0A6J4HUG2_9BACT|nr:Glucosamine-6-phosphate deaminase [uncultured Armatimonadetes bacterium]